MSGVQFSREFALTELPLPIKPNVFKAPAVEHAVDHEGEPLHVRLSASPVSAVKDDRKGIVRRQLPFDVPYQFLPLIFVGFRWLPVDQVIHLRITVPSVVVLATADIIFVERLVWLIETVLVGAQTDAVILARDLRIPVDSGDGAAITRRSSRIWSATPGGSRRSNTIPASPRVWRRISPGSRMCVPRKATAPRSIHVIYVNAGATRPVDHWLDRLKDGGRLILALTRDKDAGGAWFGIERRGGFLAKWISAADLFPCESARDAESERALVAALEKGGWDRVTRLFRRGDVPEEQCWLKGPDWCLAYE